MSDAKTERARADKLDSAIQQTLVPNMARMAIGLPNGRHAFVEFPVPLSPDDALRISGAFTTAYLQAFDAEQKKTIAGGRIVLPT